MSWLSRLLKGNADSGLIGRLPFHLDGEGAFDFDIVGESHYQGALENIAGPRTDESVEHECIAHLICEDRNPYDSNAVAVHIDGKKVGYLSCAHAKFWRSTMSKVGRSGQPASVDALIVGGWDRGERGKGSYGVKLDL